MTNHALLRHMAAHRHADGDLDRHVDRGRDPRDRRRGARHRRAYALLHCQSTYPAPFKDVNLRYLDPARRARPVPGRLLRPRARLPRAGRRRRARRQDHREALHHRPRPRGQRPQGQPAARRVQGDGAADPRGRGGARHRRPARGVDRRDDEPRQPRQVAWSPPAASRSASASTAPTSTSRAPAAACSPTPSTGWSAAPPSARSSAGDFFYATDLGDAAPQRPRLRLPPSVGPARPLPRHRDDDARHAPPTSSSSTSPTRTSRSTRAEVFATTRRPADGLTHATPPTCSPATSSSTSPARTTPTGSARSRELQRVIDTDPRRCGRTSAAPTPGRPGRHLPASAASPPTRSCRPPSCADMYARVAAGLDRVDDSGVRLCAQTLPPFPWYMGGQLFCNLFVDAARHRRVRAERYGRRLCLDVSHSKLAANFHGQPFSEATDLLAPHTEHLHLVDATGVDGEGVQVGDGEIDWARAGPAARRAGARRRASSPRSGRATSTTARASGSPWSGWSSGSDRRHADRPVGRPGQRPGRGGAARPRRRPRRASRAGGWSCSARPARSPTRLRAAGAAVRRRRPFGPDHGLRASASAAARTPYAACGPAVVHSPPLLRRHRRRRSPRPRPVAWSPPSTASPRDDLVYHGSRAKPRLMAARAHGPAAPLRRRRSRSPRPPPTRWRAKWHPRQDPVRGHPQRRRPAARTRPRRGPACASCRSPGWPPRSGWPTWSTASPRCARDHPEATPDPRRRRRPRRDAARAGRRGSGLDDRVTLPGFVDPEPAPWPSRRAGDAVGLGELLLRRCSTPWCTASASSPTPVGGNPEILPDALPGRPGRPRRRRPRCSSSRAERVDARPGSRRAGRPWPT